MEEVLLLGLKDREVCVCVCVCVREKKEGDWKLAVCVDVWYET